MFEGSCKVKQYSWLLVGPPTLVSLLYGALVDTSSYSPIKFLILFSFANFLWGSVITFNQNTTAQNYSWK